MASVRMGDDHDARIIAMTQAPQITTVPVPAVPPTSPAAQTPTRAPHGGVIAGVKNVFSFLGWVLSGFGLVGYLFRRRQGGASRAEEIVVYTVHPSFYLWALIL